MPDFTYDVLLSYARADSAWAHKTLLPRLKTEGLRVFAEHRDIPAGAPRAATLEKVARASENVLFVLTPDYVGCMPVASAEEGITGPLLHRLRRTLLNCGALDNDRTLQAVFVDSRVVPWADKAPQAGNRGERVNALIAALNGQKNNHGTPALALFLWALRDNIDEADSTYTELDDLARAISGHAPASHPTDPNAPYSALAAVMTRLDEADSPRFLPLLKAECTLPPELADLTPVDFTDAVCADPEEEAIAWRQLLTALDVAPPQEAPETPRRNSWFLAHPYPMPPGFTGRTDERRMLTGWLERDSRPVLVLRALGGFGKSALTWHWLMHDVDPVRWPRVVWWSFYETESSFESFLPIVLEYLDVPNARQLPPREQVDMLLRKLNHPDILLILDGFERALRAYSSMGAAYQGDDEANQPQDTERGFQPADCVSLLAEMFLRNAATLPDLRGKVLLTTRLMPRVLEGHGGLPLAGCREEELTQLAPADAVALFRGSGVRGGRAEIEAACAPYGYHPLSLRLLAGLVLRDLRQPGDIVAARDLDVTGDLVQRQHHVLEQAYTTLPPERQALLSRIACFRGPVGYEALAALGEQNAKAQGREGAKDLKNSASLRPGVFALTIDADLHDLIARGLLHHDAKINRYDLHPIVRRYAYDRLTGRDRADAHAHLRDYFATVPAPERVQTLDDLAPVIELYHHTVRAGQLDEAIRLFYDRLGALFYPFGAYQLQIELLRMLFLDGEDKPPRLKNESYRAWTLNELAGSYNFSGQPRRAIPLFETSNDIDEKRGNDENIVAGLGNLADNQLKIGELRAAEANLRRRIALSRKLENVFEEAIGHQELGWLLAYRGAWDEAEKELDAAITIAVWRYNPQGAGVNWAYRALRTLLMHRVVTLLHQPLTVFPAVSAAQRALELANTPGYVCPERDYVLAYWLLGAAHRVSGALDAADRHLSEALTRCRGINLVEMEADILLELARLRFSQKSKVESPKSAPRGTGDEHPASSIELPASGDLLAEARRLADEALVITERSGYVLQGADVHLFLAQIALDVGDKATALSHAQQARALAECDGEPYVYRVAYDEAGALLERLT